MKLFVMAIGLTILIEGLMPFFTPELFRDTVKVIVDMDNKTLRIIGLVSIVTGLIVLYFGRSLL